MLKAVPSDPEELSLFVNGRCDRVRLYLSCNCCQTPMVIAVPFVGTVEGTPIRVAQRRENGSIEALSGWIDLAKRLGLSEFVISLIAKEIEPGI